MKIAFIEDFVRQMQEVAVEHSKTIKKKKKENKLISDRLRDMSDYLEGDVPNRKPPHY